MSDRFQESLEEPVLPAGTEQLDGLLLSESLAAGLRIIALRALGDEDEAADAVQETLARAVEAVREGRVPSDVPLEVFVYGIARHVNADVLRRRARAPVALDVDCVASAEPSPLESLVRNEEIARAQRALARLPRRDRDLLTRCLLHGERLVDIARRLGEPVERLRKRKSRALAKLRDLVEAAAPGHVSELKTIPIDDEERRALPER